VTANTTRTPPPPSGVSLTPRPITCAMALSYAASSSDRAASQASRAAFSEAAVAVPCAPVRDSSAVYAVSAGAKRVACTCATCARRSGTDGKDASKHRENTASIADGAACADCMRLMTANQAGAQVGNNRSARSIHARSELLATRAVQPCTSHAPTISLKEDNIDLASHPI